MYKRIDLKGDNTITGSISNILDDIDCEFQVRLIDKCKKENKLELGDLVIARDKMGSVFCIHEHEVEINWRGPLNYYQKVYHKTFFRGKLRTKEWKIYREVNSENIKI